MLKTPRVLFRYIQTLSPNHIFIYDKNIVRIYLSHENISTINLIFNLTDVAVYSFCLEVFH
ncbi:hypothetical protein DXH27_00510 [Salmonella enterica]|nr:hypothetical protein [Salmonella enterica]EAW1146461.1 hypothetical protein [Salmonella enterica subsp. houtenae]EBR0109507.1 hypothetical protein [Salmonella enterica subsp. houtenae serovar Houten]EAP1212005.1 hypothetical protein [Salmonella enterica]EAU0668000.1 hypothetical protein [Salmonella enterica]